MQLKIVSVFTSLIILFSLLSCNRKGCTDSNSLAYNTGAKRDDGSCTYPAPYKKALVFHKTSTGCGSCGTWGTSFSTNISQDYPDCQIIRLDFGGIWDNMDHNYKNPLGDAIINTLAPSGLPHFYLAMEDVPNNYNTLSSMVSSELEELVDAALEMEYSISESEMTLTVQTELQNGNSNTDNYYLAIYILEDELQAAQRVNGEPDDLDRIHNNVLRTEVSNSAFGVPITFNSTGNLKTFELGIDPTWNLENLYPVAVLWKKSGSEYAFVNLVNS